MGSEDHWNQNDTGNNENSRLAKKNPSRGPSQRAYMSLRLRAAAKAKASGSPSVPTVERSVGQSTTAASNPRPEGPNSRARRTPVAVPRTSKNADVPRLPAIGLRISGTTWDKRRRLSFTNASLANANIALFSLTFLYADRTGLPLLFDKDGEQPPALSTQYFKPLERIIG